MGIKELIRTGVRGDGSASEVYEKKREEELVWVFWRGVTEKACGELVKRKEKATLGGHTIRLCSDNIVARRQRLKRCCKRKKELAKEVKAVSQGKRVLAKGRLRAAFYMKEGRENGVIF